jgi:hypothetical protein
MRDRSISYNEVDIIVALGSVETNQVSRCVDSVALWTTQDRVLADEEMLP